MRRLWMIWLILFASLTAGGCGGKATVKGKVTHAGKPVVWGTVTLVDEQGVFHQEPIGLDGTFMIHNVPTGTVKVGVVSSNPEGGGRGSGGRGEAGIGQANDPNDPRSKFKTQTPPTQPKPPAGAWFPLPEKFVDPATSGVTGTVKSGTTELNIDLK